MVVWKQAKPCRMRVAEPEPEEGGWCEQGTEQPWAAGDEQSRAGCRLRSLGLRRADGAEQGTEQGGSHVHLRKPCRIGVALGLSLRGLLSCGILSAPAVCPTHLVGNPGGDRLF